MKPLPVPLILNVLFASMLSADGGSVQFRRETVSLAITVFGGHGDISVLLQDRKTLEPVLDADVTLISGNELRLHPTREQSRNRLLYAAPVKFPNPGRWPLSIIVDRGGMSEQTSGTLNVSATTTTSFAGYIALPFGIIALFAIRERLLRRRTQRYPNARLS